MVELLNDDKSREPMVETYLLQDERSMILIMLVSILGIVIIIVNIMVIIYWCR